MLSSRKLMNNFRKINNILIKRLASSDSHLAQLRRKTGHVLNGAHFHDELLN